MQNQFFSMRICEWTMYTENISCRAIKALLFWNVVYSYGYEMFGRLRNVETNFLEVNMGKNGLFRKQFCVWHCSMNVYLFSCMVFVLTQTFHQNFDLGKWQYRFGCDLAEEQHFLEVVLFSKYSMNVSFFRIWYLGSRRPFIKFLVISELQNRCRWLWKTISESNSVFGFLQLTLDRFQMRFWARSNLFIKCSVKLGGDKTPFWCEFAEGRIFQSLLVFGNMKPVFDCFQISFLGSTRRLLKLFTRV